MKSFVNVVVLAFVFFAGVWASDYIPHRWWEPSMWLSSEVISSSSNLSLDKVDKVYEALRAEYLYTDELSNREALETGAVEGVVGALEDPYTTYFSEDKYSKFKESLRGEFEGIGARIGIRDDRLVVISPLEGTPADKSGLRAGDEILQIDETSTADMSVDRAVTLIRGEKGTDVVLTIKRDGVREPKEITITRGNITVPDVTGDVREDIAHVEVSQFKRTTGRNVADTISKTLEKTDNQKLILDLRNNGGGVLQAAIEMIGLFVERESVAVQESVRGGDVREKRTSRIPQFQDVELVVLVNQASASASEIVAGALRDLKDVQLVGKQTFGKGSVQEVTEFSDGSALKVTVAEWLTPNGTNINEEGLKPDVVVERDPDADVDQDKQLQKAIEILKKGE